MVRQAHHERWYIIRSPCLPASGGSLSKGERQASGPYGPRPKGDVALMSVSAPPRADHATIPTAIPRNAPSTIEPRPSPPSTQWA